MALEDDVFPVVADIEGAIAELGGKIRAFASETFQQLPDVPQAQAYLVAWDAFVQEFDAWRDGWWANPFRRRNEVLAYRRRFNDLQTFFRGLTGAVATTTPQFRPEQIKPSLIPSWALPVALGLGGLLLVAQLAPAMLSLKALVPRPNPRRRRRRR
jgi:hypothetical protein